MESSALVEYQFNYTLLKRHILKYIAVLKSVQPKQNSKTNSYLKIHASLWVFQKNCSNFWYPILFMIFSCTMTVQSRNVSGNERCKVSIRLCLPSHNVRLRKLFNHINGGVYHILWCMVLFGRFEGFQPLFWGV